MLRTRSISVIHAFQSVRRHQPGAAGGRRLRRTCTPICLLAVALACPLFHHPVQAFPPVDKQHPVIEPSVVRGQSDSQSVSSPAPDFTTGLKPTWIWGADADTEYVLQKSFNVKPLEAAWLRVTSDNRFRLLLDGQEIASSTTWEQPETVNLSKNLKPGEHQITAHVANAGGISGFLFKLIIVHSDGSVSEVVSDASWQAAEKPAAGKWKPVKTLGQLGVGPWNNVFATQVATSAVPKNVFEVPAGFQVERLYRVPKGSQGSWVSITVDPRGRLIASDQGNKGLYRITPPPPGSGGQTAVEKLELPITSAQGMLCAFDSLYLSVNGGPGSGLYRARDINGDDQYDELKKLKAFRGGGEHGPHAIRLSPDGSSLYIIAGNHTDPPADFDFSRVPANWSEDLLLPRQWDARGHARGKLAPGGWIARTDPNGQHWEIISTGYRNPYDMDFNADGELFAYDADMEWDMGMPWYRPTRVVHATSGSEFGWRSGTGKWPTYYPDSLPPAVDIGPGSPVGVCFGYGTRFPAAFQKALYICDWTFGTIYAIHLDPQGSTYVGRKEEFLSRTPLPLTDIAVGHDGALYFTAGGRGTQSELFRVTYVGTAPTTPVDARDTERVALRDLRQQLEQLHREVSSEPSALDFIWENVGHTDRFVRYAARIALEHRDVDSWAQRIARETNPVAVVNACIALARQGQSRHLELIHSSLGRLDFEELSEQSQLELLRAYALTFIRIAPPTEQQQSRLATQLDAMYPAESDRLNAELCRMLVYLQSPSVVSKTIQLMLQPRRQTTEDISQLLARNGGYGGTIAQMLANQPDLQKLHYAFMLRNARKGWSLDQRTYYFRWLNQARSWKGGASYQGFLNNMGQDAYDNATDNERLAVEATGARKPYQPPKLPKPRGPGQDWSLPKLLELEQDSSAKRDFENGKRAFAAARCIVCHRFAGEGGATGPDLTQAAGRFSFKDMAISLVDPSKVISDQYRASVVLTESGKVYTGRIVSETDDSILVLSDPEDPTKVVELKRSDIEEIAPSRSSLMPNDLIKPLNREEVLDLMAYLLSRGNPDDPAFRR